MCVCARARVFARACACVRARACVLCLQYTVILFDPGS